MFVKWVRQPIINGTKGNGFRLDAVLGGCQLAHRNARQIQLGTIEERFLNAKARDMRAFHQGLFWVSVEKNLNNLGLRAVAREKIEAEIASRIPRPSSEWALWGVVCCPKYDP